MAEASPTAGSNGEANELWPSLPGVTGELLPLRRTPDGQLVLAWPLAAHSAVNSAYNALIGPGEILTGRSPSGAPLATPPNPLRVARDITGVMLGIGLGAPAPEGALRVFGGPMARTASKELESSATAALKAGADPTEVWKNTGWFLDKDGKMKFEIPDAEARLLTDQLSGPQYLSAPKLPDVLEHPVLYKAYPDLKNVSVFAAPKDAPYLGATTTRGNIVLAQQNPEAMRGTLIHEINHLIQYKEGFARGGSSDEFLPPNWQQSYAKHTANAAAVKHVLEDEGFNSNLLEGALRAHMGRESMSDAQQAELTRALGNSPDLVQELYGSMIGLHNLDVASNEAYNSYLTLAGEVSSRNAEERLSQGDYASHPLRTQGYPTYEQIVRFEPSAEGTLRLQPIDHDPFSKTTGKREKK